MSKRTTYCGLITEDYLEQEVTLKGWVHNRRDLGGLIFLDLRDREGYVQIVFNPSFSEEALTVAENVRSEYVIEVKGVVKKRDEETINPKIKTGNVEVQVSDIEVINKSQTPPFSINEENVNVDEKIRLKYRYLDLRRQELAQTIKLRHHTTKAIREYLDGAGFFDIETPVLTKSTPEGARDYLVPSRVHEGEFYALPQSPQLFKQLLMLSGFDKYYQIVKCFRDEDLRADRQPEFTQVDIEMSFVDQEDVIEMGEELLRKVVKEVKGIEVNGPFPRMTYSEAMARYGSDKPDTRFDMELIDVSELGHSMDFKVFSEAVSKGGQVKAIVAKDAADKFTRKDIDNLTEFVNIYGAKGLAWVKVVDDGLNGPIARFFQDENIKRLKELTQANAGDLVLFVADTADVVAQSLGALRLKLGRELGLIDDTKLNFLWVTDWPLLEYDEDSKRYVAAHHPFTSPKEEDINKLSTEPENAQANAYDIVLNGYELGGGSIRIHDEELQSKMFEVLGFSPEQAREQFGFLLDAFKYGAPPHGGIALGLDRLVMLLAGRSNLRDTIAFPKTASATCLLTDAPSEVSDKQLDELSLRIKR
ncbi:aspartate--tRNA ligase [Staphylococcus sp. SQ8-PEA]|uniref:Aspartate--tRNA ligase n=1 Tax=Staphylococcus marylandisciuri TaxID=2981529 RepID=A0ABT2QPY6_9STAP|nr:aspartate--tRNA ligase [Staphylococcus marylandisciuri]MCU5746041.1 aspartate--tRNA ligase [Staphylococcus marylandisciuri]